MPSVTVRLGWHTERMRTVGVEEELLLDELPNPAPLDELLDDELLLDEVVIAVGCVGESSHPASSVPAPAWLTSRSQRGRSRSIGT